tara:strand:- start:1518 stop:1742 length:225 start_codon:yes stop_codon:yes gene_type:complete
MPASFWNLITISFDSTIGFLLGDFGVDIDFEALPKFSFTCFLEFEFIPVLTVSNTNLASFTVPALSNASNTFTF